MSEFCIRKNDSVADAVINERTELLYGQDHFDEELLGLHFSISPFSFSRQTLLERRYSMRRHGSMLPMQETER